MEIDVIKAVILILLLFIESIICSTGPGILSRLYKLNDYKTDNSLTNFNVTNSYARNGNNSLIPKDSLLGLYGLYAGQPVPGNEATLFSKNDYFTPSMKNWWWHSTPVFSENGEIMLFVKYLADDSGTETWISDCSASEWSYPKKAAFIKGKTNSPVFLGNDTIVYMRIDDEGGRMMPLGPEQIIRTKTGWSNPEKINIPLPEGYSFGNQFTISKNKNIYLILWSGNGASGIYVSKFENNQYQMVQELKELNSDEYDNPEYIDPSERFIIISSRRSGGFGDGDFYISYKNSDGIWKKPVNMGEKINSGYTEIFGNLTPDGRYFCFVSNRPVGCERLLKAFWVDVKVFERIK